MGRLTGALLLGGLGTAVLLGLGTWQVQRLAWKEGVLELIEARMNEALPALPAAPDPEAHRYLRTHLTGTIEAGELHVLGALNGPGYRIIAPLALIDGRRILLDRGFVPEREKTAPRPTGPVEVDGNLLWPDETDSFTPAPNLDRNIWFARDVDSMAEALATEPVLVVARALSLPGTTPYPVMVDIPNNHRNYAITWFLLAAAWAMMTGYLVWRIKHRTD